MPQGYFSVCDNVAPVVWDETVDISFAANREKNGGVGDAN